MVLTPQMVISDIVMTIGVGISQKKKMKNLTPVTILWFDPYILTDDVYYQLVIILFSRMTGVTRLT